jgi:hypothetical protein
MPWRCVVPPLPDWIHIEIPTGLMGVPHGCDGRDGARGGATYAEQLWVRWVHDERSFVHRCIGAEEIAPNSIFARKTGGGGGFF